MLQMMVAAMAAGLAMAIVFGRHQLIRWRMSDRKYIWILCVGSGIVFLPGGYLMLVYGYHILKIIRYWMLMYGLLLLSMVDCNRRVIPNKALLVMAGLRTVLLGAECLCFPQLSMELLASSLTGLIGGGLIFILAALIARRGIGMGDVKMIAVMGYYLGFRVLMSSLIIILTLTVIGGIGVVMLRKVSLRSEMPFAPFVAVGTVITILMGF